jgi:hypothetical protein
MTVAISIAGTLFIKVESIPGEFEEGEVNAIEVDILQLHVNRVAEDIEKGGYGTITQCRQR